MKNRIFVLISLFLCLFCFHIFAATNGNNQDSNLNNKQNESVSFFVRAYKNTSNDGIENGGPAPGNDTPATVKVFDSLSTRLGKDSKLSEDKSAIVPVNMDPFLNEFFTTGVHVAMITVSGVTGYGDRSTGVPIPGNSGGELYAPHTNSISIAVKPMSVKVDKDGKITSIADSNPEFSSSSGQTLPVEVFFKETKMDISEPRHRQIIKDPAKNLWYGKSSRTIHDWIANGKTDKSVEYREYTYEINNSSASGSNAANFDITVMNGTVRQESFERPNGTTIGGLPKYKQVYDWIDYATNISWSAENQIWIKGNKDAYDKLPSGTYRMVLRIDVVSQT